MLNTRRDVIKALAALPLVRFQARIRIWCCTTAASTPGHPRGPRYRDRGTRRAHPRHRHGQGDFRIGGTENAPRRSARKRVMPDSMMPTRTPGRRPRSAEERRLRQDSIEEIQAACAPAPPQRRPALGSGYLYDDGKTPVPDARGFGCRGA